MKDVSIARNKAVRSVAKDDGAILLHLERGRYHSLNGSGALLWDVLANGATTPSALVTRLAERYPNVPRERLERDVESFVADLAARGAVQVEGER